jgi:hypothetical protein
MMEDDDDELASASVDLDVLVVLLLGLYVVSTRALWLVRTEGEAKNKSDSTARHRAKTIPEARDAL